MCLVALTTRGEMCEIQEVNKVGNVIDKNVLYLNKVNFICCRGRRLEIRVFCLCI